MEHPYDMSLHQEYLMVGHPQAQAYEWLKAYALNLSDQCSNEEYSNREVTVEELLETADSHQNDASGWGGDYIVRGGAFEGMSMDPMFWEKYAIFRDIPLDQVEEAHFFSCSC